MKTKHSASRGKGPTAETRRADAHEAKKAKKRKLAQKKRDATPARKKGLAALARMDRKTKFKDGHAYHAHNEKRNKLARKLRKSIEEEGHTP